MVGNTVNKGVNMNPNSLLAKEIIATGLELLNSGLVVGTWGNISALLPDGNGYIITPSGMDYDILTEEDLVYMDLSGNVILGRRKPSSEFHLHQEIYKARPEIKAVVHTHSLYASAFAVTRKPIPPIVEDIAQLNGGPVEVADYALPGTVELAGNATKALKNRFAVLLANHGMVGTGRNMAEAVKVCRLVEKTAQIMICAQSIGKPVELSEADVSYMHNFFLTAYGQNKE